MFIKKIFKKKEQLNNELEKTIEQDEKIINSIISVEKLNKKFQKSREEIIMEKNKRILDKRDALVDVLVKGIINKSTQGNRRYVTEINSISYESLYVKYGLCIDTIYPSKEDGKNWILSLITSFETKGYTVELEERSNYQDIRRGVRIIISW